VIRRNQSRIWKVMLVMWSTATARMHTSMRQAHQRKRIKQAADGADK